MIVTSLLSDEIGEIYFEDFVTNEDKNKILKTLPSILIFDSIKAKEAFSFKILLLTLMNGIPLPIT